MNFESFLTIARAWFILAAMPLAAHHSFMAEFDQSEAVTLYGVVTKIEWINPHNFLLSGCEGRGRQDSELDSPNREP
jgi:hypothetical protein